jgi:predicted molibdopterin-dependent oxidoreductase YjgC
MCLQAKGRFTMANVTLKINGQEVTVDKGATILEAAKQAGIYIPTLCYHPYLPLEEACRICVVEEVRGEWSSLAAACVYPVRNGMVIETDSAKVIEARRTIMDLLLSDHPNDCMTCYAAGECELQDLAHHCAVKATKYEGARHKVAVDADPNPCLHIDMNKCILCRRCIRACHDIQGADIWTKIGRGFDQRISTAFDLPLLEAGCELCGHCADFCPVDAIGFRNGRGVARAWQLQRRSTICLQCPSGCRAEYDTFQNKIVRVLGDFQSSSNLGALCKRGRFNFDFINAPDRLTEAAVRNDKGELEPCSVETATKTAASALAEVREASGGSAVAILCGGMLTNEEYYLAQKLARGALLSNHIDNLGGPWQQAIYEGLKSSLGFGAMTNSLSDIAGAGAVLVLGSNTLEHHAIAAIRARKAARDGAPLIVANAVRVPLSKTANLHLSLQEGGEPALILALMKIIVEEGLHDGEFLGQYTRDFAKLERSLQKVNMADLAAKTGISEEELRSAARLYASRRPACLVYGVDPATSPASEAFFKMCASLQLLLGSVGVAGGGVNAMGVTGNCQGAADFGALPKYLPGYRPVTAAASRKLAAKVWGTEIPEKAGMNWPEMLTAIEKGDLKALYLLGVDPFELGLNKLKMEGLLARLELLVVQGSNKTGACDYAHVILPAATFVEKEGTATNCERRVQRLEKVLANPGEAHSDFDLINGLLGRLQPQLQMASPEAALVEAARFITELNGISPEQIPIKGLQWPVDSEGTGTERLLLPETDKTRFKFFAAGC